MVLVEPTRIVIVEPIRIYISPGGNTTVNQESKGVKVEDIGEIWLPNGEKVRYRKEGDNWLRY